MRGGWGLGFAQLGEGIAVGKPNSHLCLCEGHQKDRGRQENRGPWSWTERDWSDWIKEKKIPMRIIKHWIRVPREAVIYSLSEVFKTQLNNVQNSAEALNNVVCIQCWLYFEQEVGLDDVMSDSMNLGLYFILMYLLVVLNLTLQATFTVGFKLSSVCV